jgi:transmembrane sensor
VSDERRLLDDYADAVGEPDTAASERMERALMSRLERKNVQQVSRLRWAVVGTALAAAAAFVLLFLSWGRGGPISTSAPAGVVAMATSDRAQTVQLPHDGVLELSPNTEIRLEADEASGATVELLAGAVLLDVNSGPGLTWRVLAGDHEVLAVGTRYRVEKTADVPAVVVEEGVVRLSGPSVPAPGVFIRAAPSEPLAAASTPSPPVEPAPAKEAEVTPPEVESNVDARTVKKAVPTLGWVERFRIAIREGDDEGAVVALPKRFPTGRESLGPADYVDAGDALRAVGDRDRAERSYTAACDREGKSNACGVATVRLAISRAGAGDRAQAIALASRYLDAHPDGTLARDALGRRMEWRWKAKRRDAAQADAKAYLDRWPRGSRAELARSILQP